MRGPGQQRHFPARVSAEAHATTRNRERAFLVGLECHAAPSGDSRGATRVQPVPPSARAAREASTPADDDIPRTPQFNAEASLAELRELD